MFTDEQINAVGKPAFDGSCLTEHGRAVVRSILDAAIAQGLVRPVTVTDEEYEELFGVFSEGVMDVPTFLKIVGLRREHA